MLHYKFLYFYANSPKTNPPIQNNYLYKINLKVIISSYIFLFIFNVMNMVQRAEDVDYEPDVLKFKQIWDQMNQTKKERNPAQNSRNASRNKSKIEQRTKQPSTMKEKQKQGKKQTIISGKNINRNPKKNQQVIDIVTKPQTKQDPLKNQKNAIQFQTLIQVAPKETTIAQVSQLKKSISQKDHQLSLLRVKNTAFQGRIKELERIIQQKQDKIQKLQSRQRQLLSRNNALLDTDKIFDYGKIQYQNFKNDTRRLLKMLQSTTQYQQFANLALQDNAVRFLNSANKKFKSSIDSKQRVVLHFCTCNKDFIPQSGFWVPEKVYNYGKQFIKQRKGVMTPAELELLLYDLNKIYRERQKRIINTLNSQKAKQVDFLKRKLYLHKGNDIKQ